MNNRSSETASDPQMNRAPRTSLCLLSALALAAALTAGGCSEDGGENDGGAGSDNGGGIDFGGDGSDGSTSFGGGKDENGNCIGLEVNQGCAGQVYEGEAVPLDLYVMFDQSGSMAIEVDASTGATRMDVVTDAVEAFLNDEESIGLGIGIGYFGHQPLGETTCDVSEYDQADVEIAALPGNIDPVLGSLAAREPTGETPTGSAIRGACDYVAAHKATNPGRSPAVLLVTDGEPKAPLSEDTCAPTLSDAAQAAKTCYESAGIPVYVLGVGPSLDNLDLIAESGGTESAYLADSDNTDQVLGALRAVRIAAQIPCELEIAESESDVDYDASTVAYQDSECDYIAIDRVESIEDCSGDGGWYFDDPEDPTNITMCEATCGDVKSTGRQLFYSIGCQLDVIR